MLESGPRRQLREQNKNMDPLSPRDANLNMKPPARQTISKSKSAPEKVTNLKAPAKGKDHPPPPPLQVCEPPSFDRRNGAVYTTGKCLGKGGFAICYDGILEGSKHRVALKIVKSHMPQKKMEQKFQTELQIHSKMRHPNIVQFHRAFTFEQSTYIVLELCPNGSLMDMVKKRRFVSEAEVRFWTVQMAGAIKYMHCKGIVHRDLKMGNIFLDKNMNIKVGDFGLAAILLTGKDMTTIRRTTLCGTPNYIAPEILEKGKGGHDNAVDIWSLGIIIYAMLTGKPPFQSDTQDEIYRRARERDYDWPALDDSTNTINQEVKTLVADMLQPAELRPTPDTIVEYPFFTSGYFPKPEDITYHLREFHPDEGRFQTIEKRCGPEGYYARVHQTACEASQVGKAIRKSFHKSIYQDVTKEEMAGLTPLVPLPDNIVYRPYDEMLQEGWTMSHAEQPSTSYIPSIEPSSLFSQPTIRSTMGPPVTSARITQSYAAQQRASHLPPQVAVARPLVTRAPSSGDNKALDEQLPAVESTKRKLDGTNVLPKRTTKVTKEPTKSTVPRNEAPEAPLETQARRGADLAKQLHHTRSDRKYPETEHLPRVDRPLSLFSMSDEIQKFPTTRPDHVLDNVKAFHAELERALNSRSLANTRASAPPVNPPVLVIKWVDYTNKFGLGYILSNGSIGCIFIKQTLISQTSTGNRQESIPQCAIVVPESERHLQLRDSPEYSDYNQIIPVTNGKPVEFYENNGEEGIYRVKCEPKQFLAGVGADGKTILVSRTKDEFEDRKRQKVMLWKKFASYMTNNGRDVIQSPDPSRAVEMPANSGADVVTFYQRFGDVGCWLFLDGHSQFNFPDHTKIILSADGKWCDFYHLPLAVAQSLRSTCNVPDSALDERQKLSYPLQTLLNFHVKPPAARRPAATTSRTQKPVIDPTIQGVPQANDFRKKVEFIRDIVGEWIAMGGLGMNDMSVEGRLRWAGNRDSAGGKGKVKHVWTTVGARGGDERRVAWFDPQRPGEIGPDIE